LNLLCSGRGDFSAGTFLSARDAFGVNALYSNHPLQKEPDVVDFRKRLGDKRTSTKPLDPNVIYEGLDRVSDKGPLRPAQKEILDEWHRDRRKAKDVIVKMHTGQGKTLIGLLILQSKLNEDVGPALYLCPNNHLVDQTVSQAKQFGITCATAPGDLPTEFLESKQILVTSVQKLFNGLTKFKLGAQSQSVGTIVMDDCHACIDAIREHCVIEIPRKHRAYDALLALFATDLKEQGAGTFADIREQKFDAFLPVPYWSWMDRHEDVAAILAKDTNTEEVKYAWPLLKDILGTAFASFRGKLFKSPRNWLHCIFSAHFQKRTIASLCLPLSPMTRFL
jgi:Type III restriction enzyme, res subunit